MASLIESIWYRAADVPDHVWQWFFGLSREEWLVTLAVAFTIGFVSLLGFTGRRL
jgi:hypothetical protein